MALDSSDNMSNISSSPEPQSLESWIFNDLIPVVVLSFCFLLGVPGNITVIILKPNWQHLSSLSQSLMLNLAFSDLLCLLIVPLRIYNLLFSWTLGLVTCKLLMYLVYCSIYCSMLTVTALSVQRYLQVVHLQNWFDRVGKKRILVLLWLIAMVLAIPSLVFRQLATDQDRTSCVLEYSSPAQWIAMLLSESLTGIISLSVVIFSYISLHRKVNRGTFFNNPQTNRLVTRIIVTFFVLWMPYHITNILCVAAISLNNDSLWESCSYSWDIVRALVFVNSALNPLLYAFASRNMCTVCQKRNEASVVNPDTVMS